MFRRCTAGGRTATAAFRSARSSGGSPSGGLVGGRGDRGVVFCLDREVSSILVAHAKVIFLHGGLAAPVRSSLSSPGFAPGAARKMFEPCLTPTP